MTRTRWIILVVGPLPILAVAFGLTRLADWEASSAYAANEFMVAPSLAGTATDVIDVDEALRAECAEKARRIGERLGDPCRVWVAEPFVIAGDLSEDDLRLWYRQTIEPATGAMLDSYFRKAPDRCITVLLFSGEAAYEEYADALYGDRNISVYGYYKPRERTLVMNIGTGGGTLVHELTHALIDFDFPEVPDWFNEGLASLHEQCRFQRTDERRWIEGLENWRLPALQSAIEEDRLRSLHDMLTANDFRENQVGLNYAQARYLCFYLQHLGKLGDFYRQFHRTAEDDPLGTAALKHCLDDKTWEEIDQDYRRWVLTLRYNR